MPVIAKSNESGMANATMSAARQLPKQKQQHDHDKNRALEEIRRDSRNRPIHEVVRS